jgi:hypothetical protein
MSENIFFQYLTKENMISIIKFLPLDFLMNILESKYHFRQNITFMYGDKEALPPAIKKNHYTYKKKIDDRLPSDKIMISIDINDIDDLKIFYIDLLIKNIFPMNLIVRSLHSIDNLKEKVDFDYFFNNHYLKENLSLFFEKLPFFNIHPEIKMSHLHKVNLINIDRERAFIINFENSHLEDRWNNYNSQKMFIIILDNIQFYKLFMLDLIVREIAPKNIISISDYSHEELFKD